jgi:hypothetical protein
MPSTGSGYAKIYQSSNSHPALYMANAAGTATIVLNSSGVSYLTSGNIIIGGTADNGNLLQVQGTGYFLGNVGIGTASPLSILHVVSREIGNGANKGIRIENYNGTKDYSIRTGVSGAENTSLAFYDETAGANRIVITSGGNVGIGTTSPDSKLDVTGGNITINTIGTFFADFKYGAVGSEVSRGSITTDGIDLKVNATADLLLLPTGNVGIGTTSPAQKLQVNGIGEFAGALRITETGTSQNILIGNQDSGGTNTPAMINGVNGSLRFGKGNSWSGEGGTFTETMRVDLSGNVGIGTTSPGWLHSDSTYTEMRGYGIVTNRAVNYYRPTADKTQILGIGNDGNTWNYISHNANYHTFSTDLAERMRIDLGGNVGIGTTSPLSILHVVSREIGNGANKGIRIENYNGTKDYSIRTGVSGAENTSLAFYDETAGANRIVITSGGNVGIGTTSPTTPLHVAGIIQIIESGNTAFYGGNYVRNVWRPKLFF